jgi:manganese-dependent inorganic pyrophosphatase
VAGCLGYVELATMLGQAPVEARFAGVLNAETRALLAATGVPEPTLVDEDPATEDIALVDTHHPNQLPAWVDHARVRVVIDHHPDGDASAFPRAAIQNELVGAACTLVAERFHAAGLTPSPACTLLLLGGIVSNTLGFAAPSTCERDRVMYAWLEQTGVMEPDILAAMRVARDEALSAPTTALLDADVKIVVAQGERIALSQLEASGCSSIADRPDFWSAADEVRRARRAAHIVVNLVDLQVGASRIAVAPGPVRSRLIDRYALVFHDGTGWSREIFLRKTHLVPLLVEDD